MRRYVRGGSAQQLDWLVVEEITQLDMALWADLACVGLNADVKFLLLGDFGRPISAPLEHSQLIRDLAGGHRRELTENVKWLRVGEEACPTLEQAKARLRELYPSAANRALAPEASKLLELETQVIHIDLGETQNGCDKSITQNSPQSMRVWRGCASLGPAERYPRASLWPWRKWSRTE